MRYACPSCKRVFYLETKTVSPCPACGTTLTMEGDDEGGGAAAAPPAPAAEPEQAAGGSWLSEAAGAEAPTQKTAAPVPPAPAAPPPASPAPSSGAPTVQSWLTPPADAPAPVTDPALGEPDFGERETLGAEVGVQPPLESDLTNSALDALNAAARPAGRGTSGFPAAPRTSRMSATRGPSGSRVFLMASAAVLVTAAIAVGAIVLFGKKLPTGPQGGADVRTGDPKEMEALRTRLSEADDKLAAEQERARIASKARQDLELKLEEAKLEADGLKRRLERLSSSLGYVLEAQALLERHSDLEGALSLVDAALKRDPGMIEAWRLKGKIL
ncbi:MAG: hypothetical protein ACYTKD_16055, partial [Planctomycetota bacterium]